MMPQTKPRKQAATQPTKTRANGTPNDGVVLAARRILRMHRGSQKKIAKILKVKEAVVSQVLAGKRRSRRVERVIAWYSERLRVKLAAALNGGSTGEKVKNE
ncbi:MAG TPA: hypothetical protein VGR97_14860 [Candidatus Acidoferrales bacterium]|nr:hypothetical protein [Candidatus Acidoferrales bacterium]